MKRRIFQISVLLIIVVLTIISCVKKEFDTPPSIPTVNFESNKSIKALIASYEGGIDTVKEDWIIKGVVVGNDESGNIYKTLYIQDDSAAINIQIDRTNMFNEFKIGQLVYVKMKGLCLGEYGEMIQIGYPYIDGGSLKIGRIPDVFVDDHLFRSGLPGTPPAPKLIPSFNDIRFEDRGRLVMFNGITFETPCEVYAYDYTTTNVNMIDKYGQMRALRTSNYANFRANTLPNDTGTIIGICSYYDGDYQFYIRDLKDVIFTKPCQTTNLISEDFASGTLGTFKEFSVKGAAKWHYDTYGGENYAYMSGYESGDENEDWLISPAVNLDLYSEETLIFRTAQNYGNPAGTLKLYYSSNYSGSGAPSAASWTEIPNIKLSGGGWSWVSTGNIDVSNVNGTKVFFALKYTCQATNAPTWEVTNIRLRGKKL